MYLFCLRMLCLRARVYSFSKSTPPGKSDNFLKFIDDYFLSLFMSMLTFLLAMLISLPTFFASLSRICAVYCGCWSSLSTRK